MEVNTVVISLKDYHELVDLRNNVEDGKVVMMQRYGNGIYPKTYMNQDDHNKELLEKNNKLTTLLNEKTIEIINYKNRIEGLEYKISILEKRKEEKESLFKRLVNNW